MRGRPFLGRRPRLVEDRTFPAAGRCSFVTFRWGRAGAGGAAERQRGGRRPCAAQADRSGPAVKDGRRPPRSGRRRRSLMAGAGRATRAGPTWPRSGARTLRATTWHSLTVPRRQARHQRRAVGNADRAEDRADDRGRGSTRAGFAVLGVAIRREPRVFAISTVGSRPVRRVDGGRRVGAGLVDRPRRAPAFRDGEIDAGLLWAVLGLFLGVALLRAVGIVARRVGAGIMQFRMQAAHPTGGDPAATSSCRWSGTSATPPGSCSPTPTPTSRPRGARSRRCRWRWAPSR